jgi:hypothetical protein
MSSECHDEVGSGRCQHLSIVCKSLRASHLGCSPRDQTSVRVLNSDQFHVRHSDEVTEVGGIVKRMPVANLDSGNANGHGSPLGGRASAVDALHIDIAGRKKRSGHGESQNRLRYRPRGAWRAKDLRTAWSLGLTASHCLRRSKIPMSKTHRREKPSPLSRARLE